MYELIQQDRGSTPRTSTKHEEKRPLRTNEKTYYEQTYEIQDEPHN